MSIRRWFAARSKRKSVPEPGDAGCRPLKPEHLALIRSYGGKKS